MATDTLTRNRVKSVTALLVSLGLAMGLAACGQRGPLEAPTANTNTRTDVKAAQGDDTSLTPDEESSPTKAPDKGFILDPLL